MANRRLNTTAVADATETPADIPVNGKPKISRPDLNVIRARYMSPDSPSGINVPLMKPYFGKEELPPSQYKTKKVGDKDVITFISYGEPRFFVNRTEVVMVFRGNQRVERRLFTVIQEKNARGKALRAELQKARIPGA